MSKREFKSHTFEMKAVQEDKGIITGYVSVFNNIDYGGDKMMPGAFDKTLSDWKASGDPIPVIWSHQWDNPDAHIGYVTTASADAYGLLTEMQFDLDKPFAKQVFDLMKSRRVREFSFGYIAEEAGYGTENGESIRELRSVRLLEVGPTLVGMNPATQLLEAASYTPEALKAARDVIDAALKDAGGTTETPEAGEHPVADEKDSDAESRDMDATIDTERLIGLLSMTRYREV